VLGVVAFVSIFINTAVAFVVFVAGSGLLSFEDIS
jgi:hypothetical protein